MKVVKCFDVSRSEKYIKIKCDALLFVNGSSLLGSGVLKLWQDNHIRSCSFSSITKLCSMNSFTTTNAYSAAVSRIRASGRASANKMREKKRNGDNHIMHNTCVSHPSVIHSPSYVRVYAPTMVGSLMDTELFYTMSSLAVKHTN